MVRAFPRTPNVRGMSGVFGVVCAWYNVVIMFKADTRDLAKLEHKLLTIRKQAYPFAVRATLNNMAFDARRNAVNNIQRGMILRNKFTERSIRVDKAAGLRVDAMQSVVGSTNDYMADQEFGATKSKQGTQGVPIPTSYSAGQGYKSKPRTRAVRRPNWKSNIQLRRSQGLQSRRQRNLVAVKQAAASGKRFVYLELQRRRGIFRVLGGKRKPYVRMVYDLSKPAVRIPANPWLKPAADASRAKTGVFYADALRFQLRRHRII